MLEFSAAKRQGDFTLDLSFTAEDRQVTALFGRSGAGKSSIIGGIAGLIRPEAGRVALDGAALYDSARGIDLAPARRRVGVVFQDSRLFPHLPVRDNLLYGWRRKPDRARGPSLRRRPGRIL